MQNNVTITFHKFIEEGKNDIKKTPRILKKKKLFWF